MPMLWLMYFLNYLDRNAIATSKLNSLEADLDLTGSQYLHECEAMMQGFMHHKGGYWHVPVGGSMDVKHHDDVTDYHLPEGLRSKVCEKTVTYQLDGHVGLLADLALMAQAAAHAREVCPARFSVMLELTGVLAK